MSKCPSGQYPECWFGCPEKATCLDLSPPRGKMSFAVRQVICSDCGQYESDCKCPVVSPPPVAEDLGERILEQAEKLIKAYQARVNRETTDEEFKKVVVAFPGSILQIIEGAGYVKLIPDPLKGTPIIKNIAKFVDSASEDLDGRAEKETKETKLKKIALEVFGSRDGFRPRMPTSGDAIQIAMELSFDEGMREMAEKMEGK